MIALAAHELAGPDLEPVDFLVPEARVTALVGPAGPARTRLLHLLAGLEQPTSGWVEVARIRLDELAPRHLAALRRTRVGLVLERFNLIPHLTVAENAGGCLDLVDLTDRAGVRARDLRDDERVRVALARALATDPAVVLIDAPGLDVGLLRRAADATGAAIILATDDEDEAAGADRVVRM